MALTVSIEVFHNGDGFLVFIIKQKFAANYEKYKAFFHKMSRAYLKRFLDGFIAKLHKFLNLQYNTSPVVI
ncbi:hypothetical protein G3KMM_00311 [Candidatus Nanosyncoccus nanoralicus]|jgi:hypothetical protein|uniref:Uncharacterized protein n=1 Tax=Candidatus Nanosyncoccus nanoralicus TaxID=2171996 RepID=A0ABY0FLN6_9BACT|nr:hypothetical protein G3KMM_00311 [Candidatus Nanosyncoccus nanoralicus]